MIETTKELLPRWYVWTWRSLILGAISVMLLAAAGACWSNTSCALFLPSLPSYQANLIAAWWLVVLIAAVGIANYIGAILVCADFSQPMWIRLAWILLLVFFLPLGCLAYWVDCVERKEVAQQRASRVAAACVGVLLILAGVKASILDFGHLGGLLAIAVGGIFLLIGWWLLSRALGWHSLLRRASSSE